MNIHAIKKDFPIFDKRPDLIYLDSAATTLTPQCVIDKVTQYYTDYNANIARGTYKMSEIATEYFESSRTKFAHFIGTSSEEIVFTSGTTMSLNMIARGLSHILSPSDTIITTTAEHHANFIPWQRICKEKGAKFHTIHIKDDGDIDMETLLELIDNTTKIITLSHVSNVLGTVNPIKEIIQKIRIKKEDVIIVVDAAQSIAHIPLNVIDLDCDFLAFSLHKLFGPTGVGVLYGKKSQLQKLTPLITGGEMITEVTSQKTTYRDIPYRLEAGTPHIAGVIAAQEAIAYIENIGFDALRAHEQSLTTYCIDQLTEYFHDFITIYGPHDQRKRSSIISFKYDTYHPHDIASILDTKHSIAIRAGQHCAMPLHLEDLHIGATARISLSIYNTKDDIDTLITGLTDVADILSKK